VPRQVGWLESPSRGHRWWRTRLRLYETQMRTKPDLRAKTSDHDTPLRRGRAAAPAIGGGHSGKRRIRGRECRSGKADFEALNDDGEPLCASVIDINLGNGPDGWAVAGTQRFANKVLDAIMFRTGNSLHSESVGSRLLSLRQRTSWKVLSGSLRDAKNPRSGADFAEKLLTIGGETNGLFRSLGRPSLRSC
jgi:hypothetical protein